MTQLVVSGARGGRHYREIGERADELGNNRADAASAANDENRGGRARHRLADIHAVEQGFPRGDRMYCCAAPFVTQVPNPCAARHRRGLKFELAFYELQGFQRSWP